MACDTFIKIALKCRRHFVTPQTGELVPFIEEILSTISSIICDLQTQQVKSLKTYEVVMLYMLHAKNFNIFIDDTCIEYNFLFIYMFML